MNSMITSGSYDKHLEQIGAFSDIDPEEREEYCVMTCEVEGFTFEGTGTYSCGELIIVDNIEVK